MILAVKKQGDSLHMSVVGVSCCTQGSHSINYFQKPPCLFISGLFIHMKLTTGLVALVQIFCKIWQRINQLQLVVSSGGAQVTSDEARERLLMLFRSPSQGTIPPSQLLLLLLLLYYTRDLERTVNQTHQNEKLELQLSHTQIKMRSIV